LHPPQNEAETVQVTVLSDRGKENRNDLVVREHTLSIVLNGENFFTLICTPKDLPALAVGHLFTQGFISGVDVIEEIQERSANTTVSIRMKREAETDNAAILPPGGIVPVAVTLDSLRLGKVGSGLTVSSQWITQLAVKTEARCEIFRRTGGTHACALSDTEGNRPLPTRRHTVRYCGYVHHRPRFLRDTHEGGTRGNSRARFAFRAFVRSGRARPKLRRHSRRVR
jgi:formate dehydrogenase assembly factor FdhD